MCWRWLRLFPLVVSRGPGDTAVALLTVVPVRLIEAIAFAGIRLSIRNQSIGSQNGDCGDGGEAHISKVVRPTMKTRKNVKGDWCEVLKLSRNQLMLARELWLYLYVLLRSIIQGPTGYRHGSQDHNSVFVTMSLFK